MRENGRNSFAWRRLLPLALLLGAGAAVAVLGGHRYLNFTALAAHHSWACALVRRAPVATALAFIAAYAGLVALSVPGSVLFTIAGGVLFGAWLGTAYAVIAATIGATAVFVAARTGFAGLTARAGPQLRRIEAGFRKNALSYLLVLRLVPVFPFWLVNLVAGAAGMRLSIYLAGTLFGMIPATFVYASLGSGLGTVVAAGQPPDLEVLFRPGVLLPIVGLAILALLPVAYRGWREQRAAPPSKAS